SHKKSGSIGRPGCFRDPVTHALDGLPWALQKQLMYPCKKQGPAVRRRYDRRGSRKLQIRLINLPGSPLRKVEQFDPGWGDRASGIERIWDRMIDGEAVFEWPHNFWIAVKRALKRAVEPHHR